MRLFVRPSTRSRWIVASGNSRWRSRRGEERDLLPVAARLPAQVEAGVEALADASAAGTGRAATGSGARSGTSGSGSARSSAPRRERSPRRRPAWSGGGTCSITEFENATGNSRSANGSRVPSPVRTTTFALWSHSDVLGARSTAMMGFVDVEALQRRARAGADVEDRLVVAEPDQLDEALVAALAPAAHARRSPSPSGRLRAKSPAGVTSGRRGGRGRGSWAEHPVTDTAAYTAGVLRREHEPAAAPAAREAARYGRRVREEGPRAPRPARASAVRAPSARKRR